MHISRLPLTTLGHGHTKLVDKLLDLCWAIWLTSGPCMESMRAWLGTVRVFLSDMGIEMGLCDAPD
eukprot:11746125-Prorocentrum_lima.AAC.1